MGMESITATDIVIVEPRLSDYRVVITPAQQGNLLTLAMHLLSLPGEYPDFKMDLFTQDGQGHYYNLAHKADCGTAACAVGHGPMVGIEPLPDERWTAYSNRVFIPQAFDEDGDEFAFDSAAWEWCFSGGWARVDNSAHGAAHRILWLLKNRALPDDAYDQERGTAPTSYWPKAESSEA